MSALKVARAGKLIQIGKERCVSSSNFGLQMPTHCRYLRFHAAGNAAWPSRPSLPAATLPAPRLLAPGLLLQPRVVLQPLTPPQHLVLPVQCHSKQ